MDTSTLLNALLILATNPSGTRHGIPGVSESAGQLLEMLPDDVIREVGGRLGVDTSEAGKAPSVIRRMLARSVMQMRHAYTTSPIGRPLFPEMEFSPEDIEKAISNTSASRSSPAPVSAPAPTLASPPGQTKPGTPPVIPPNARISSIPQERIYILQSLLSDPNTPPDIRHRIASMLGNVNVPDTSSARLSSSYPLARIDPSPSPGSPPAGPAPASVPGSASQYPLARIPRSPFPGSPYPLARIAPSPSPGSPPAGPASPPAGPSAVPTASSPGRLMGALSALRNTGGPALGGGIATAGLMGMADDAWYGRDINPMHAVSTGVGTALAGIPAWESGTKFLPNAGNVLKSGLRNVVNKYNVLTALSTMAGQGLGNIAQRESYDLGRGTTDDSTWKHVGALGSGAFAGLGTGLAVHPAIAAIANAGAAGAGAAGAGSGVAAGALGASVLPAAVIAAILATAGNYGISHLSENIGRDAADLENSLGSQFAARDKEKYFHDASAKAQSRMQDINDAYINRSTGGLIDPSMRESYQAAVRALADEMKGADGMDDLTMSRVMKEATGGDMYGHYRPEAPPENPLNDRWYSKPLLGLF